MGSLYLPTPPVIILIAVGVYNYLDLGQILKITKKEIKYLEKE